MEELGASPPLDVVEATDKSPTSFEPMATPLLGILHRQNNAATALRLVI